LANPITILLFIDIYSNLL